jgi:hypothetical protein
MKEKEHIYLKTLRLDKNKIIVLKIKFICTWFKRKKKQMTKSSSEIKFKSTNVILTQIYFEILEYIN